MAKRQSCQITRPGRRPRLLYVVGLVCLTFGQLPLHAIQSA